MGRKLRSVGHLGPFWPNPMRAKGASQLGPKPQLGPPETFLATTPLDPKMTKNLMDTILAINPVGPDLAMDHQISSVCLSPQLQGFSSFPSYHPYSRLQAWCIYGIIYHYAPFLLSNPMVTFSGPNSTFPNQDLKSQRPF
ncbi:hypothetical protein O181_111656 [Austropuccinia psidii MF-1]|uniref:Uncharacterized protein n=1 Tax=Austropuccinia psidii MF-1 TaxID=1389203 RepID=A0A9Q3PSV5_9BASI|nr:hypothetical protein [Austropuccinia psidii MF-1]